MSVVRISRRHFSDGKVCARARSHLVSKERCIKVCTFRNHHYRSLSMIIDQLNEARECFMLLVGHEQLRLARVETVTHVRTQRGFQNRLLFSVCWLQNCLVSSTSLKKTKNHGFEKAPWRHGFQVIPSSHAHCQYELEWMWSNDISPYSSASRPPSRNR